MIEFCGCVCSRLYGWAAESIVNAVRPCGESGDEPCAYYYTWQHGSTAAWCCALLLDITSHWMAPDGDESSWVAGCDKSSALLIPSVDSRKYDWIYIIIVVVFGKIKRQTSSGIRKNGASKTDGWIDKLDDVIFQEKRRKHYMKLRYTTRIPNCPYCCPFLVDNSDT